MKFFIKTILCCVLTLFLFAGSGSVWAQNVRPRPQDDVPTIKNNNTKIVCGDNAASIPGCYGNMINYTYVKDEFLGKFSSFQVGFIGLIAVVILTVAGLLLVASLGDPARKKKAIEMATNALIGVVIAMLAYILVQLVLGLDFQNVDASGWLPATHAQDTRGMIPPVPSSPTRAINLPIGNPNQDLGYFIQGGLNVMFYIAGPIVILVFIILGVRMVQAEGKDDEYKKVWKGIGYAALGLSFIGLAYAFVRIILSIRL